MLPSIPWIALLGSAEPLLWPLKNLGAPAQEGQAVPNPSRGVQRMAASKKRIVDRGDRRRLDRHIDGSLPSTPLHHKGYLMAQVWELEATQLGGGKHRELDRRPGIGLAGNVMRPRRSPDHRPIGQPSPSAKRFVCGRDCWGGRRPRTS